MIGQAISDSPVCEPAEQAPAEFVAQVAEALRRLYDPSGLLLSPLVRLLLPTDVGSERRASALRTLILDAIEALNPGPRTPPRSANARSYQALSLHYVSGHTVEDLAHYLALSVRQAYRAVRRAEADLANILWQKRQPSEHRPADAEQALRAAVGRRPGPSAGVSLAASLRQAASSVAPLAEAAGISLPLPSAEGYLVRCDGTALGQCLTAILSYAVQSGADTVGIEVTADPEAVVVYVVCAGVGGVVALPELVETAQALAEAIGAGLSSWSDGRKAHLTLRLPRAVPATLMVIDDNEGLALLFERYLSGRGVSVEGVADAQRGLRLAAARPPSAIVLDIIMPDVDGWAVLAGLKANPATASVPVIVCSVFRDPGLARSLGAAAFVSKPVTQADLLRALEALGLV